MPPPSSILVSINENLLTKFKAKGVVGIIIDEDLTFTLHIEHILSPHLTFQLWKAFTESKLEFGCTVWGFRILNAKHLKLLESTQRGAASLILKTMNLTPTGTLESKLSILPIDLRLEEMQRHEAVKQLIKEDDYIHSNMIGEKRHIKLGVLLKT